MTLQDIFNSVVLANETVSIPFADVASYNSFRVALLRKFKGYRDSCQSIGLDAYDGVYIACSRDASGVGTFAVKPLEESKRVRKQYAILKL